MNMKRAFLAAVAVLMMPGLAMAQTSSSTFPGSFEFDPAGPDVEFDLTLTCNGGTPLTQTVAVAAEEVINFTVVGAVEAAATCDFSLSGLPATGWSVDDNGECSGIVAVEGANDACIFTITPDDFTFSADLSWTANSDMGSDVPVSGDIMLGCTNVWQGSDAVDVSYTYEDITSDGPYSLPGDYAPYPTLTTVCSASLSLDDSAVEVDNSDCSRVVVAVGDGDVSCDIEASVFFEGIPTLSQYGMALMALLMLGVGFIGFRRFV